MKIVIDIQGAQSGSRFRGIGRYSVSITKAIIRNKKNNDVVVVMNAMLQDSVDELFAEFEPILGRENIKLWHGIPPISEIDDDNKTRNSMACLLREAFIESLRPDFLVITSLFEGLGDNAISSVPLRNKSYYTGTVLYDLIPLINPDDAFQTSKKHIDWYKKKLENLVRSDLLFSISEHSKFEAVEYLDYPETNVVNISGGFDSFFNTADDSNVSDEFVRKFDLNDEFVFYTGGADDRKNLIRLIRAFSLARKRNEKLVFAGGMPEEYIKKFKSIAIQAGLDDKSFIVLGYVTDHELKFLYRTCTLFVFPSLHEGLGLPPLEAMACGAPVISSNATSLKEVMGLVEATFDPLEINDMVNTIERGLYDKSFRGLLISHAKKQINKFSWDDSALKILNSIDRFVNFTNQTDVLHNFVNTSIFKATDKSIVALKLDHFGDFILAIPAFSKLRNRYKGARIDIVVGSWNYEIAKSLSIFDNVYTYDFYNKKSSVDPTFKEQELNDLCKKLPTYDYAIDFRRQPDTRKILNKIKASSKVGYTTGDQSVDIHLDFKIKHYNDIPFVATPLNKKSISKQMLNLVDILPGNDNDFVDLPDIKISSTQTVGNLAIFPTAGKDVTEWGGRNFIDLVNLLKIEPNINNINLYFSNYDESVFYNSCADEICHLHYGYDFFELCESLKANELCIGLNSGGSHLASFLGLNVIALYSGHELVTEWAPCFGNSYVIDTAEFCSPCHSPTKLACPHGFLCMNNISVNVVLDSVRKFLKLSDHNSYGMFKVSDRVLSQRTDKQIVDNMIDNAVRCDKKFDSANLFELSHCISQNHPCYLDSLRKPSIAIGSSIPYNSLLVDWHSFSDCESGFRWSNGKSAKIEFYYGNAETFTVLNILLNVFKTQSIAICVNNRCVYTGVLSGDDCVLKVDEVKIINGRNTLEFTLPDACIPSASDQRLVAVAIKSISFLELA